MKLGLACRSTFSLKAIMSLAMSDHLYCNVAQKQEKKLDDKFRSSLYEKFGWISHCWYSFTLSHASPPFLPNCSSISNEYLILDIPRACFFYESTNCI